MTSRSILRCDSEYSVLYSLGLITEAFLYPNLDYKIIVMVTWTINAMNGALIKPDTISSKSLGIKCHIFCATCSYGSKQNRIILIY